MSMEHPCFFCGAAAHPSTGHAYTPRVLACYRCTVEAWSWVRDHTNKRSRKGRFAGTSFYEAATRQVEPTASDAVEAGPPSERA
jgi:hypothetical protein